jgi:hypothetical protein
MATFYPHIVDSLAGYRLSLIILKALLLGQLDFSDAFGKSDATLTPDFHKSNFFLGYSLYFFGVEACPKHR